MIKFREASLNDLELYFKWANDQTVRQNSFKSEKIKEQDHDFWFKKKLLDPDCLMLVFYEELDKCIGQVIFQKQDSNSSVIGLSVDKKFRGKGYSKKIIVIASDFYQKQFNKMTIKAYIKKNNFLSVKTFISAGFEFSKSLIHENFQTLLYIKKCK